MSEMNTKYENGFISWFKNFIKPKPPTVFDIMMEMVRDIEKYDNLKDFHTKKALLNRLSILCQRLG